MSSSENTKAILGAAATMAVIGAIDGYMDQGLAPNSVRTGWKTFLSVAGIYINIQGFMEKGGRFESRDHLSMYLACLAGITSLALYVGSKKN